VEDGAVAVHQYHRRREVEEAGGANEHVARATENRLTFLTENILETRNGCYIPTCTLLSSTTLKTLRVLLVR
jgi:hypothetical protein